MFIHIVTYVYKNINVKYITHTVICISFGTSLYKKLQII
jgi:hypothetical protein